MMKGGLELIVDKESIMMCLLITTITLVVIGYSQWYMKEEEQINIFICQLMVFAVGMEIFVTSKSYLVSFLGWEVIGVLSFTLINFWSNSLQNNKSALKAIIFNKVGDLLYLLALGLLFLFHNSSSYSLSSTYLTLPNPEGVRVSVGELVGVLLILAAMAKSAQIFLHCWLGDAMAGPTPVSALLHAATMVTAGVYLLIRSSFLFHPQPYYPTLPVSTCTLREGSEGGLEGEWWGEQTEVIRIIITNIGLLTIIFAGLVSLNQYDIKKIIAYSTCSQIGYMFISIILVSPDTGSLYHLITHAFAKALLFLSGGVLIHSYWGEQDIRKFGGLIDKTPSLFLFFLIGSLSLIGLPGFSGFFSKELILFQSFLSPLLYLPFTHSYSTLPLLSLLHTPYSTEWSRVEEGGGRGEGLGGGSTIKILIIGSLLTTLYCLRLVYYIFFKKPISYNNLQRNFSILLFKTNSDNLLLILFFSFLLMGCFFIGYSSYFFFVFPNLFNMDPFLFLFSNSPSLPPLLPSLTPQPSPFTDLHTPTPNPEGVKGWWWRGWLVEEGVEREWWERVKKEYRRVEEGVMNKKTVTTLFILPFLGIICIFSYYLFPFLRSFSIFFRSLYFYSFSKFFHTIFNSKLFFDSFYNYFLVNPSFSLSYHLFFKVLERGFIENLLILAPSRLLNSFYTHFSFFRLSFHNLPLLPSLSFPILSHFLSSLSTRFFGFFYSLLILFFSLLFLPLLFSFFPLF